MNARIKYFVNYGPNYSHRLFNIESFPRLKDAIAFAESLDRKYEIVRYEDKGHPFGYDAETKTILSTFK